MLGISPRVAADYLGQALALRHRFPFTWARVLAGEATPWKACRIVADCAKLSEDAAAYVDQRIARLIDSITPYRLDKIVKAAKMHADPDLARAEAAEKARERGVFVGRSNEHGTKTMYIKAAAGAVIRTRRDPRRDRRGPEDLRRHPPRPAPPRRRGRHHRRPPLHRRTPHPSPPPPPHHPSTRTPQRHRDTGTHPRQPPPAPRGTTPGPATPGRHTAGPARARSAATPPPAPTDARAASRRARPSRDPDRLRAGTARPRGHRWPRHRSPPADRPDGVGSGRCSGAARCDEDLTTTGRRHDEPGPDDEADRDAPHPSTSDLPDPLDTPDTVPIEPFDPSTPACTSTPTTANPSTPPPNAPCTPGSPRSSTTPTPPAPPDPAPTSADLPTRGRLRPGQTEIYVHLTDHTLATGTGVLRAEGIGPLLADQLAELIGHGPYTVKPVIDLNDAVSVDAYEIPDRIRERVKLTHPVELFPFGTQETHRGMDLDHIQPYDPLGPPGQTSTPTSHPSAASATGSRPTPTAGRYAASTPRPWNGPHPTASPSTSTPPAPTESRRRVRRLTQVEPKVRDR